MKKRRNNMSNSKEYKDYVLEQLRSLDITVKPMMGEYLLYYGVPPVIL